MLARKSSPAYSEQETKMPQAPQPNSTHTHPVPQNDLGCTIDLIEIYSGPDAPGLDFRIDWHGKTPTSQEQDEADARTTPEELARLFDYRVVRPAAAQRIMGRWSGYNEAKILAGDWGGTDLASFFAAIGPVVVLLFSNGFGACRDTILVFNHIYATAQAKYDYLQIMKSEYPALTVPTLAEIEAMGQE